MQLTASVLMSAASSMSAAKVQSSSMSAATYVPAFEATVLWDVDGTLVESTKLAFDATNEVLAGAGREPVTVDECRWLAIEPTIRPGLYVKTAGAPGPSLAPGKQ